MTECHDRSCSIPFIYVTTQLVSCIESTKLVPFLLINLIIFLLTRLHWVQSYKSIQLISIWIIKWIEFHSLFHIPFIYLDSDIPPVTFHVEYGERLSNNVPIAMIGLAQTSREILEYGGVPIFPVVLSTSNSLLFNCDRTGTLLSTLCMEVNKICIWP